jgi:hypothetical protein
MKVGCIYQDLANKTSWYTVLEVGWLRDKQFIDYEKSSAAANILRYLGIFSFTIMFSSIVVALSTVDDYIETLEGKILCVIGILLSPLFAYAFVGGLLCSDPLWNYLHWDYQTSPATGTLFGLFIGIISGLAIGIIVGFMKEDFLKRFTISVMIFGIVGVIIGGFFYNNGFIVSLPIVPAFASIGYAIGVPIKEKAGQRAEIKRREELERERRIREEERRRLEYEQKIKGYKSKYEQYKREGYKPDSDLEEMLK